MIKPLIIIPSYNTGLALLQKTVKSVLDTEFPVWIIMDGSTDGSEKGLKILEASYPQLKVIIKPTNTGKGDALHLGMIEALDAEFTHALVMDSDGQHPASSIVPIFNLVKANPNSIIMGQPVFGDEAPKARIYGRKLTTFWTNLETLWCGLGDTLFGMRAYPLIPMKKAFQQTKFARGFDFDPEIAVRMVWLGVRPVKINIPVKYLLKDEGGISHFHYLRDNLLLIGLHFRLIPEFIFFRAIPLLKSIRKWKNEL